MFDRRLVHCFNWGLLGLTLIIGCLGLLVLYSAGAANASSSERIMFSKQIIWLCAGLALMVFSFLFNYKLLDRWGPVIYIFCILLLVAVSLFGKQVGGAQRWLMLGPVSIQPSELVKIAVIIMLARYYAKVVTPQGINFKRLFLPLVWTLIPFVLIVKQPDLGTAMLVLLIAVTITLFVKIEKRTLMGLVSLGMMMIPVVWFFLKGYQKQRILTFLSPDRDPLGAGYHIIQSKIAIGSGMILGKGYLKGSQNTLSFLPEQHTDFIFSVISEEWGFVGAAIMVLLFLMLIVRGLQIAYVCKDPFGTILSLGVILMLFWQVIINIGMVMGLMPVVGVPLPLVSYGGSSIMTLMICIGILLNVSMRRFMFE
jgi:rod shape determining protein RodA